MHNSTYIYLPSVCVCVCVCVCVVSVSHPLQVEVSLGLDVCVDPDHTDQRHAQHKHRDVHGCLETTTMKGMLMMTKTTTMKS